MISFIVGLFSFVADRRGTLWVVPRFSNYGLLFFKEQVLVELT